jgi:5-hydroxyisourate hydrolase-like protein (transthyretin family)
MFWTPPAAARRRDCASPCATPQARCWPRWRRTPTARTDAPILPKDRFAPGIFELTFHAGDYLRATGQAGDEPLFLDLVPIRFGMSDGAAHYHVPLLLSPYGYSTYRGS